MTSETDLMARTEELTDEVAKRAFEDFPNDPKGAKEFIKSIIVGEQGGWGGSARGLATVKYELLRRGGKT